MKKETFINTFMIILLLVILISCTNLSESTDPTEEDESSYEDSSSVTAVDPTTSNILGSWLSESGNAYYYISDHGLYYQYTSSHGSSYYMITNEGSHTASEGKFGFYGKIYKASSATGPYDEVATNASGDDGYGNLIVNSVVEGVSINMGKLGSSSTSGVKTESEAKNDYPQDSTYSSAYSDYSASETNPFGF